MRFIEYFDKQRLSEKIQESLIEHHVYKPIPGTNNSYRKDSANSSTLTQIHSHTFAKPNGKGKQLFAVNFDGSGHDGSSGIKISDAHADFFRSQGYAIPASNVLESLSSSEITSEYLILEIIEPSEEKLTLE